MTVQLARDGLHIDINMATYMQEDGAIGHDKDRPHNRDAKQSSQSK
jgi:hypothetical protein